MANSNQMIAAVADRLAIEQVLASYCHGVDRCNLATLQSAFWEDATLDFGTGPAPAHTASEGLINALHTMRLTHHQIGNIALSFKGGQARGETYVTAFHIAGPADAETEIIVGGRYLDIFAKRDGDWRIFAREYVMDWNSNRPSTMASDGDLYDQLRRRGARHPHDPYDGFANRPHNRLPGKASQPLRG